ncbi:MAG TPA: response regulator [Candidatus Sulfotelmatobacter sp.]|jgi:CheY-like chemotaxis protein|nr:response regulator [Candidatus Sulfotelmatobacter sp.]
MTTSPSLGLDGLLHGLLRHMVEEASAACGVVVSAGGAVLARHPMQEAPAAVTPDQLRRIMAGESWSEETRLYAPLTIGAAAVAALVIERAPATPFPADLLRRLLAHASHTGLAWSHLPEDVDPETDPLPPLHVLVAEDNEVNRKVAKAFLEHAGHAVAVCGDGQQAVEAVREGDFDVVLMDIRMPGMDGVEATRAIRALPDRRRAGLPILALTANFTPTEVEVYIAAGMNDVIRKPLRLGDIERALAPYFGLPEETPAAVPTTTTPEDGTHPVLDQDRVALLAEALPPARLMELFESARVSIVETLAELRRDWEAADIPAAGKAAHRLAGVAANFGCTALGELARAIEADCKQNLPGNQHAEALGILETLTLEALSDRR